MFRLQYLKLKKHLLSLKIGLENFKILMPNLEMDHKPQLIKFPFLQIINHR
jgi:hypothetical protein